MSKVLTETSAFTGSIVVPEDGIDLRTAASVESPIQALANRTRIIWDTLVPLDVNVKGNIRLTFPAIDDPIATQWQMHQQSASSPAGRGALQVSNLATNLRYFMPLPGLNSQLRIEAVTCYLNGGNAVSNPHSALPATMPQFEILKMTATGTSSTSVTGIIVDASASVSAYDDWHSISFTLPTPYVIQDNEFFWIRVSGETGTNSQTSSLLVRGFAVRCRRHALA